MKTYLEPVAAKVLTALFVAVKTVYRTVGSRLKWKLGNTCAALRASKPHSCHIKHLPLWLATESLVVCHRFAVYDDLNDLDGWPLDFVVCLFM